MTPRKTPAERVLEVAVFGPAGLAFTLVEEFPKLVDKGRQRVEGQVRTARVLGQFAVQMGRAQLEQTLGRLGGTPEDAAPAGDGAGAPSAAHDADDDDDADAGAAVEPRGEGTAADGVPPGAGAELRSVPAGRTTGNGNAPDPALAIPGYDSLSASQVVQRLEGLSPVELEDVRAHEAAHRQRRTILHRVEQLLAAAPPPGP
ncbi:MAG: hypothetical protein ABSG81_15975 [Acidimicrobiales bacterium]